MFLSESVHSSLNSIMAVTIMPDPDLDIDFEGIGTVNIAYPKLMLTLLESMDLINHIVREVYVENNKYSVASFNLSEKEIEEFVVYSAYFHNAYGDVRKRLAEEVNELNSNLRKMTTELNSM